MTIMVDKLLLQLLGKESKVVMQDSTTLDDSRNSLEGISTLLPKPPAPLGTRRTPRVLMIQRPKPRGE